MIEDDRYCIDIVTQIAAVRSALRRVEEEILRDHVGHCVEHAIASGNKADQRRQIEELMAVVSRATRSTRPTRERARSPILHDDHCFVRSSRRDAVRRPSGACPHPSTMVNQRGSQLRLCSGRVEHVRAAGFDTRLHELSDSSRR